ncbi:hypothetical protein CTI12_AA205010 [Artemisia annua]|uniref:Uncharacterized protein n=1 Tax=Artemisia annua TaxID=35608 RepID=A0A2U1P1E5_ARTAN|nr:hypothetical protein CTI12_AA205010 [Artemisia annua]
MVPVDVQRGQQTSRTDTIYKLAKAVLNLNFSRSKDACQGFKDKKKCPDRIPVSRNSPDIENPNSLKKFCRIMDKCKDNRTQIDRGMDDDLRGANYSGDGWLSIRWWAGYRQQREIGRKEFSDVKRGLRSSNRIRGLSEISTTETNSLKSKHL